jgi:hypothetical protein
LIFVQTVRLDLDTIGFNDIRVVLIKVNVEHCTISTALQA